MTAALPPARRALLPRLLLTFSLGVIGGGPAQAADDEIATDRPDFVESSDVVGRGRWQIETSIAYERDRSGGLRTRLRSTPTLLRIGTGDNWELRLETDGALRLHSSEQGLSERQRGWSDLALGLKWHQSDGDEESGRPGLAWLLHVDVDSGSPAFRGQGLRPSLRMVAEWELPGGWSAGVMPGLYQDRDEQGRRYVGGILAAVLGKSLTADLRGFIELAGQQLAPARHGGHLITLDAGLALLLNPSTQLDLALARGLNKNSPDFAWTLGLSLKY